MHNERLRASCALNVASAAMGCIGLALTPLSAHIFLMYTVDSNLLALVACAIMAWQAAGMLRGRRHEVAPWAWTFKHWAAVGLALTFLVVAFVLAPAQGVDGYRSLYLGGHMPWYHLLCPLATVISFVMFDPRPTEAQKKSPRLRALLALAPTLVYAVIILALNAMRAIEGPYPFFRVWAQPWWATVLWMVGLAAATYGVSLGLLVLSARRAPSQNEKSAPN